MTVLENVLVGRHSRMCAGLIGVILRLGRVVAEEGQAAARAMELLSSRVSKPTP